MNELRMTNMKKILILAILMAPIVAFTQAGEINWMTIEEAEAAQKKESRKVMVDVYTKWCGPCKMLDKNTFHNADVVAYVNANYYAVKLDAETPEDITFLGKTYSNPDYDPNRKGRNGVHQISRYLRVSAYPTIIFMDEAMGVITPVTGYRTPQQLEIYLKFFETDSYKNVKTKEDWEKYQADFVYKFK